MTVHVTAAEEYARKLALHSGTQFEIEVITALQESDLGFQRIPRKPNGDGGLDGLSQGHALAYCCYGPEAVTDPGLTDAHRRRIYVDKIVEKFTDDLLLLLELKRDGTGFKHSPNSRLAGILGDAPTKRIAHIRLITGWFEDNRIIGGIKKAFARCLKASKCRFVDPGCQTPIVWGPTDVANNVRITQVSLARVEQPALAAALKEVSAASALHEPAHQDDFNDKFDDLIRRNSAATARVEKLRTAFKKAWSKSILLDARLASDLPHLHQRFEDARPLAATDAQLVSAQAGTDAYTMIQNNRERLRTRIADLVHGGLSEWEKDQLAEAETGRLIGECDLDWRDS